MKTRRFLIVVMFLFASAVSLWADDPAASVDALKNRAAQGDTAAQFKLGFMYTMGQGVPLDYTQALKWFRLAAAQGFTPAQYNLGVMYNAGQGVPQDYTQAFKWFRLVAAQGDATAQFKIGFMYITGQGIPQDYA